MGPPRGPFTKRLHQRGQRKPQSKCRAASRPPAKQKGPCPSHNSGATAPDEILEGQAGPRQPPSLAEVAQAASAKCGKSPPPQDRRSAEAKAAKAPVRNNHGAGPQMFASHPASPAHSRRQLLLRRLGWQPAGINTGVRPQRHGPRTGPSPPLSHTQPAAAEPPPARNRQERGAPPPARTRPVKGAPLQLLRQKKCRIYALSPAEPHKVMAILPAG
ncbi:hypothetical protein NDU88_001657 [Pleurodeles waltl]|uniref:Uncharacterized protein n=1 Tax=Pleurodeles waltl TaxID=8319 RepID=A0AAV7Q9F5_PLEWA|nr:hypothetical protein NDU88_001657 [Pleurodeles waltl]